MENDASIKIIDNFLSEEDFCSIQSNILGHYFPWYYNDGVVNNNDEDLNNYQFTHCFYSNFSPKSDFFNFLQPILNSIKPNSLIRIKANLLTKTENHIEHGFHIDIPYLKEEYNSKTAILYMNTNNGYTKFEDGTKVDSVENRLVVFDSRLKHTGTTCTDQKKRVVINFNYF
ncbi:MAG: hypothetical protein EBU90_24590 [Proteobacteria bacterium]|nr:hypothetical protein [Pseudomonadota bacterium]